MYKYNVLAPSLKEAPSIKKVPSRREVPVSGEEKEREVQVESCALSQRGPGKTINQDFADLLDNILPANELCARTLDSARLRNQEDDMRVALCMVEAS